MKIWKDSWLPNHASFKICSPPVVLASEARVSELIDTETKSWKRDLIRNVFSPFEAKQILNIPLSWRLPEDKRIWHWEKNGRYSVRSAHRLTKETSSKECQEASSSNDQELWKAIWRMKAPPSVQNFLWRLAKDILPTRSKLRRKGMLIDTICPLCFEEEETLDHLFMCCRFSQQTWFSSTLGLHVASHCFLKLWMSDCLNKKDHLAAHIFGITLWKIWQGRN